MRGLVHFLTQSVVWKCIICIANNLTVSTKVSKRVCDSHGCVYDLFYAGLISKHYVDLRIPFWLRLMLLNWGWRFLVFTYTKLYEFIMRNNKWLRFRWVYSWDGFLCTFPLSDTNETLKINDDGRYRNILTRKKIAPLTKPICAIISHTFAYVIGIIMRKSVGDVYHFANPCLPPSSLPSRTVNIRTTRNIVKSNGCHRKRKTLQTNCLANEVFDNMNETLFGPEYRQHSYNIFSMQKLSYRISI